MKKLINISLLLLFTLVFFACEKEIIMPVNQENKNINCFESFSDSDSFTRDADDITSINDSDSDDNTTDTDTEDGEDDDNVTDPDEEEDFEEEDFSK
jgi:hypothetical protein